MKPLFLFLLFVLFVQLTSAQAFRRKKALNSEIPPRAVLVELFTGYKRFDRTQDDSVKKDLFDALSKANKKMIMDFEDNFKYCPVYYFYDSNIVAIQNGDVVAHLYDDKGNKVLNPVVSDDDTTFFLLYYGILVPDEATPYDQHVSKKMLVALDHRGDVLHPPLPRTPGPANFKNLKSKKFNVFYRYSNLRTDTHYRACAKRYSVLLKEFYGKYPYKLPEK